MQRRTVLLISSPEIGWADLRAVLRSLRDIRIAGEATTAREAIAVAAAEAPGVIISAATVDGTSAAPLLLDLRLRVCPTSKIVVFASRLDPADFAVLGDDTLDGYLLWSDLSTGALRPCLDAVIAAGLVVVTPTVARTFIATRCRPPRPRPDAARLTRRERTVLRHLAGGLSRDKIATAEQISARTVDRILAEIEAKLDAPNAFVLGVKACQLGLI
jgi:DNA-binding NarL/FixJ family response regulator